MKIVLGLVLLGAVATSQAAPIAPFTATFTVSRNGDAVGHMRMALSDAGNGRWQFASHTTGEKGMAGFLGVTIDEKSELQRDADGFATLSYRYQQKMFARNRVRTLTRDAGGSVKEADGDDDWSYQAKGHVYDRHSVVLGIADHLARGSEKGVVFSLPVASKGKLESWRFLIVGLEEVSTGNGPMDAFRVERMRENSERKTVSWHAADAGYLPVKVEQTEPNGDKLSSVLDSFSK